MKKIFLNLLCALQCVVVFAGDSSWMCPNEFIKVPESTEKDFNESWKAARTGHKVFYAFILSFNPRFKYGQALSWNEKIALLSHLCLCQDHVLIDLLCALRLEKKVTSDFFSVAEPLHSSFWGDVQSRYALPDNHDFFFFLRETCDYDFLSMLDRDFLDLYSFNLSDDSSFSFEEEYEKCCVRGERLPGFYSSQEACARYFLQLKCVYLHLKAERFAAHS